MGRLLFKILICASICLSLCKSGMAQGDNKIDTLTLTDNTLVTGQIENLYEVITHDGNIGKREFKIDTGWGKRINIPLSQVKYLKAFGTAFEQVELNTGVHQMLEIVSAGKVSLYFWRKITLVPGAPVVNAYNDKGFKPAGNTITNAEGETWMILAKDKWYDVTAAFIKKKFSELFGDCPTLVEEAKSKDFNYKAIGKIVKEYNGCF